MGRLKEEKSWRGVWLKNAKWILVKKGYPIYWKLLPQTTTKDDKRIPHSKANTIQYRVDYFAQKLHVNQNEKLEMYGVVHVVAIDGHSRFITCGAAMPMKSNKVIHAEAYKFISVCFVYQALSPEELLYLKGGVF